MKPIAVTITFDFDPIDVTGTGMWSSTGRQARYRANGVSASAGAGGGVTLTWLGSKAGRHVNGFWSDDTALDVHRVTAVNAARRALESAR